MAYLALYRRFRPQQFSDLVGQETVVRTLENQIKNDRIGHAYLFCGARGTGKTTAAKIFARAINCEEKSGEPCGKCETCLKLKDVSNLDIIEMDAASNNRVDNAREIREKVQYPPTAGRFKVYIIDEVHMLTTDAFNALLKTLEEPPKHAVFILATTEPHKLPATILSRCMRFDFKLIPTKLIAEHIASIFDSINKDYDFDAVTAIARAGEGSLRDALSIADICLSFSDRKLTYSDVIEVLGASNRKMTYELCSAIFTANTGKALEITNELINHGKNVGMLLKDLLQYLREIMVAKTCKDASDILSLPADEIAELKQLAELIDNHGLLRISENFSFIENEIKYSTHPRVIFETAIVKSSQPRNDYNIDALLARISKLEQAVISFEKPVVELNIPSKSADSEKMKQSFTPLAQESVNAQPKKEEAFKNKENSEPQIQNQARVEQSYQNPKELIEEATKKPQASNVLDKRVWGMIIRKLRSTKQTLLWAICQDLSAEVVGGKLIISTTNESEYNAVTKKQNLQALDEILKEIAPYDIVVNTPKSEVDSFSADVEKIKNDFGDIEIKD